MPKSTATFKVSEGEPKPDSQNVRVVTMPAGSDYYDDKWAPSPLPFRDFVITPDE